jgi:hypothetical protein
VDNKLERQFLIFSEKMPDVKTYYFSIFQDTVFEEGPGKYILASSLDAQSSYTMIDSNGISFGRFTYHLLEGLKGGRGEAINEEGYVTPSTLSNYILKRMPIGTEQKPVAKVAMSGDIVIMQHKRLMKEINRKKDVMARLMYRSLAISTLESRDEKWAQMLHGKTKSIKWGVAPSLQQGSIAAIYIPKKARTKLFGREERGSIAYLFSKQD